MSMRYARIFLVACIVGNTWTVKRASQLYQVVFFRSTYRLHVHFRTFIRQIMHCIEKRCKLTVVVLFFTVATYYSNILCHHFQVLRLAIYLMLNSCICMSDVPGHIESSINADSVRGLKMITSGPGGARLCCMKIVTFVPTIAIRVIVVTLSCWPVNNNNYTKGVPRSIKLE